MRDFLTNFLFADTRSASFDASQGAELQPICSVLCQLLFSLAVRLRQSDCHRHGPLHLSLFHEVFGYDCSGLFPCSYGDVAPGGKGCTFKLKSASDAVDLDLGIAVKTCPNSDVPFISVVLQGGEVE